MESSMGWELHAQDDEDCEYVRNIKNVEELIFHRIMRVWLYPDFIFNLLGYGKLQRQYLKVIHGQSIAAIKRRQKIYFSQKKRSNENDEDNRIFGAKKRYAFLDLLLEESTKSNIKLTYEDLREEVDTIMFAGHDTTSIAVSFCLWFLGHNPDLQDRVYEEICDVAGASGYVSAEHIKQLKLLEACIKEAIRIAPPVPQYTREVTEDCTIGGYKVPAGTNIILSAYMLHRDPKYFPDAERYNPDRFLADGSWPPYAYVPFSAGPRNCIGQKFAMQMMKVIISWVIRSYVVTTTQEWDDLGLSSPVTLAADNGILIALKRRSS